MSGELSIPEEPADGEWYDPELSFLHALERDVRRHARHVAQARASRHTHERRSHGQIASQSVSDSRRAHGRPSIPVAGGRMARRSLILLALLSLIGATAFGAGRIFTSVASNPAIVHQSAFAHVARGSAGGEIWSLQTYTRGGQICRVLVVGEAEASRCSKPPASHALGATSAFSPTHRYVFGVAGRSVAAVEIADAAGLRLRVETHALPTSALRVTGLRTEERWYVAVLARPAGEPDPPLRLQPLDRGGHTTGSTVLDCPEGFEQQSCPR